MKVNPTFEAKDRFVNERTEEKYVIINIKSNKKYSCPVYVLQAFRHKFDMFEMPEAQLQWEIDKGDYTEQ
jgi:hypothetical protein